MTASKSTRSVIEINGVALRGWREARGRAVAELAEALGVTRSYIARIETGHSKRVSALFYGRAITELAITDYRGLMLDPWSPINEAVA